MTDLYNGQIADLLNNGLRYNPETIAMGYAIREEKRRILALEAKTRLMSAIDAVDEKTLDYLAVELRTPAYSDAFPIETKRSLVRDTLAFYARLGTPAAVNWLIQTIFGAGSVEEWFDYEGEPHHFRVNIGTNNTAVTPENLVEFRRMIASVKRLSSWMDTITSKVTMPNAAVYPAPLFHETRSNTVLPYLEPEWKGTAIYVAPAMSRGLMTTRLPILEDAESQITVQGTLRPSGAFQTSTQTKLPTI